MNRPIFIVGGPRSGTTLLRNMLNRHPALAICRETSFYHYVYIRRRNFGSLSDLRNRERLVKEYLATDRIRSLQMDLPALQQTLLAEGTSYDAFFASLVRFYARSQGKKRGGEKTPHHALFTETLCEWYPDATVIHVLRDPRDVVASLQRMPWGPNSVLGNTHLWLRHNLAARRSRLRPQYLKVRYEQLVARPEEELKRICSFVGEEYSPAMLVPNWDPTASRPWIQRAEEPVTTGRVGKWRAELTADEVALVEWAAGPHLQKFGYEAAEGPPTSLTLVRGLVSAAFDSLRRRAAEFPGSWYFLMQPTKLVAEETAKNRYRNRHVNQTSNV